MIKNLDLSILQPGDIILFRGGSWLSKTIQYFDNAYYNHIGIIDKYRTDWIIIDSNAPGVHPDWLSNRLKDYLDICILRPIRPQHEIDWALEGVTYKASLGIKYDFSLMPRVAISRKFGYDIKKLGKENRDICSEFARRYTNVLDIKCYQKGDWVTPQDFIRFLDPTEIKIIYGTGN